MDELGQSFPLRDYGYVKGQDVADSLEAAIEAAANNLLYVEEAGTEVYGGHIVLPSDPLISRRAVKLEYPGNRAYRFFFVAERSEAGVTCLIANDNTSGFLHLKVNNRNGFIYHCQMRFLLQTTGGQDDDACILRFHGLRGGNRHNRNFWGDGIEVSPDIETVHYWSGASYYETSAFYRPWRRDVILGSAFVGNTFSFNFNENSLLYETDIAYVDNDNFAGETHGFSLWNARLGYQDIDTPRTIVEVTDFGDGSALFRTSESVDLVSNERVQTIGLSIDGVTYDLDLESSTTFRLIGRGNQAIPVQFADIDGQIDVDNGLTADIHSRQAPEGGIFQNGRIVSCFNGMEVRRHVVIEGAKVYHNVHVNYQNKGAVFEGLGELYLNRFLPFNQNINEIGDSEPVDITFIRTESVIYSSSIHHFNGDSRRVAIELIDTHGFRTHDISLSPNSSWTAGIKVHEDCSDINLDGIHVLEGANIDIADVVVGNVSATITGDNHAGSVLTNPSIPLVNEEPVWLFKNDLGNNIYVTYYVRDLGQQQFSLHSNIEDVSSGDNPLTFNTGSAAQETRLWKGVAPNFEIIYNRERIIASTLKIHGDLFLNDGQFLEPKKNVSFDPEVDFSLGNESVVDLNTSDCNYTFDPNSGIALIEYNIRIQSLGPTTDGVMWIMAPPGLELDQVSSSMRSKVGYNVNGVIHLVKLTSRILEVRFYDSANNFDPATVERSNLAGGARLIISVTATASEV